MLRAMRWAAVALAAAGALLAAPAWADEPAGEEAAAEAARAEKHAAKRAAEKAEALAALKRLSDFLGDQERFGFEVDVGYDVVQPSGQKLEFGGAREVVVRRPDRARIAVRSRDGDAATVFFDGQRISVDLPAENAYASVEKPGSLEAAIDYLVEELETPAPLADFLAEDLYAGVVDKIESGFVVGDESIGGTPCDHLAFRGADLDFQLWIAKGDRPLARRVVITYREEEGEPQFWARFRDWNLSPKTPDSLFAYTAPPGAERIPFAARSRAKPEED